MNLLLDTHVLLWWLDEPSTLSEEARLAIADGKNKVFVSAANAWEITIKKALGKLDAPDNLEEVLIENQFFPLPITIAHALAVSQLPRHHSDPFDRILAAQAKFEGLTLVTHDKYLKRYYHLNLRTHAKGYYCTIQNIR
jgi:PIN domain nuclease of toxin-antitoxin system